ncbi:ankyrin repeat protein, partial [Gorgonomyces haynaldii]
GASPLSTACQNGHMQIASLLIEFGAVIKASDSYGCTPLHWAANSGHPKLVQMLMNKGKLTQQDLSKKDNFGSTPLHFASVRNMLDTVGILLQAGSDPYQTNNDGRKSSDL